MFSWTHCNDQRLPSQKSDLLANNKFRVKDFDLTKNYIANLFIENAEEVIKGILLSLKPYAPEISQMVIGLFVVAFTLAQCTKIDHNFTPGKKRIVGILINKPVTVRSVEGQASIKLNLDNYPMIDFFYSPDHFINDNLPRLEDRLNKGDTIVMEIFLDDYKRKLAIDPTLTEYFIFGDIPIISIQFDKDKYTNSKKPQNEEPNYFTVFLIYTVICAFFIINGYLSLLKKLEANQNDV